MSFSEDCIENQPYDRCSAPLAALVDCMHDEHRMLHYRVRHPHLYASMLLLYSPAAPSAFRLNTPEPALPK